MEKSYIKLFGRKDIGNGILYNQTDGGDGGDTSKSENYIKAKTEGKFNGHRHKTSEQLEKANIKRSVSLLGHEVSLETKKKISETRKNKKIPSPNKGKTFSENIKEKLRIPKKKYICFVCSKNIGGKTNLIRWHNENCKMKGNINE